MKIKESDLKKIIKESVLEGLFGFGTSMSDDNQVIDLWANLFDVARDQASKEEIYEHAEKIWMAVVGTKLKESPQMWEQEIRKALRSKISSDDLKNGIKNLVNTTHVGPWMKSSYGELVSSIMGPAAVSDPGPGEVDTPVSGGEVTAEPIDDDPTTGTTDVGPTTHHLVDPGADDPRIGTRITNPIRRKDIISTLNALLHGSKDVFQDDPLRATHRDQAGSRDAALEVELNKILAKKNLNIDPRKYIKMIMGDLKNLGVDKLSESRLKKIVLEETVAVLREIKRR